ncbi:serine racemase VanT catalytic subunit [Oscillibacter sp. MSJ-2]|uniref:Alanine racemase n=2 Tax=Dysosmobacter acutus TaxID=2841504 RepID=A0ABS6F5G7_9FIRM|nr:serine racemase VanT catalytic subunit [Dysosmobacter acutus]
MKQRSSHAALDLFRVAAAVLVVAIHTSPLTSYTQAGDFFLTRILGRVAVPFFFMVSGYFLAQKGWVSTRSFLKKTLALYGGAVLLYLPLNWYQGGFSPWEWVRRLLVEGTLYHLWYFPALVVGVLLAKGLLRLKLPLALTGAALLYLVGLGGDSYYGLAVQIPGLKALYDGVFQLFSHTRNGLFFAPLFLLLGAVGISLRPAVAAAGLASSFAAMTAEAFLLRSFGVQRHDSMYLFLPLCMVFLFSLLLSANSGENRTGRRLSALIYLLHPWCIVLVRGGAKVLRLNGLLIENSLFHFAAVLTLSCLLSALILLPRRPRKDARAWREIDIGALETNAKALRSVLSPGCRLMAVVKADAYGHGAVPVARALQRQGIREFAVACLAEGVALRRAGIRGTILILGYTDPTEAPLLFRYRLTQAVADLSHAQALSARKLPLHVHVAVDTGLHRLGVDAGDHEQLARLYRLRHLRVDGTFSHLSDCDSLCKEDMERTRSQLEQFQEAVDALRFMGCRPGKVHIQSSYAVWNLPPQRCDYARIGIALYGVYSSSSAVYHPLALQPVLSLKSRVASVRTLDAGEWAGYGKVFQTRRETRLATVSIGYADGLPRDLPQRGGTVLIHGQRCPMVGRMFMDQLLVDVTDCADAAAGDVVTLIGQDGPHCISAERLAVSCGTITNELLSRLGQRLTLIVR